MTTHVENRQIRQEISREYYNNRIIEINALIASDENRIEYLNEFYEKYFSAYGYEHLSDMDMKNPPSIYEGLFDKDDNLKIYYKNENTYPNFRQLILEEKKYRDVKLVVKSSILNHARRIALRHSIIPPIYKRDFPNSTPAELKSLRKDALSMRSQEIRNTRKVEKDLNKKEEELKAKSGLNGFCFI